MSELKQPKYYDSAGKAMHEVGKTRQDVCNIRMQTKRFARGW